MGHPRGSGNRFAQVSDEARHEPVAPSPLNLVTADLSQFVYFA